MIVLIVIGVLILLLVLLVNVPVTAHIKFYGGRLEFALKYLGIGILKFPREKKKKRRKKLKRSRLPSAKMSSSEKPPSEEDEDIFEDIAEIGFTGGTNDGSELESGFDEDDLEEGYVENRENEQENISGEKFDGGGYRTEDSSEKNAEISMNNPEDDSGNSEEKSEDNSENDSENFKEKSTVNSEGDSGNFKEKSTVNSEGDSEKSEKNLTKKSDKKLSGRKKSAGKRSSGRPDGESNDDEPKKPLGERLSELLENIDKKKNAALLLWELCEGNIKKLLGKFTVDGLVVDFAAADEDAARAALAYGKLCAGFYNLLGVIMSITRVKIRSVSIDCLYNTPSEKARYDGEFKVRLRPASVLNALNAILFDYVRGRKKYKPALDEFIGSSTAAVSMSADAVKRYRAKNSTN